MTVRAGFYCVMQVLLTRHIVADLLDELGGRVAQPGGLKLEMVRFPPAPRFQSATASRYWIWAPITGQFPMP